jgi:hypothetical protein
MKTGSVEMSLGSVSMNYVNAILNISEQHGANKSSLIFRSSIAPKNLTNMKSRVSCEKVIELFQRVGSTSKT